MKKFVHIKNKIKKYSEEINLLNKSIEKENENLKKELSEYWYETKFIIIKYADYTKEYYYLSHFDVNDSNWFYGIKIDNKGEVFFGKHSVRPILLAEIYETIDAGHFFSKLKSIGINLENSNDPLAIECSKFKPVLLPTFNDGANAVGYCRLSQNGTNKNKYDRQICLIQNRAKEEKINILKIFAETIPGTTNINERQEILSLLEYCSLNNVTTLFISELNRLGRLKRIVMSAVTYLMKHGITEIHVVKENIIINQEFIEHNYRKLGILAQHCEDDYNNIIYRMREGYNAFYEKRKNAISVGDKNVPKLGRQNYEKKEQEYLTQYAKEIDFLNNPKMSLRQIHMITGTSLGTLAKLKKMFNIKVRTK